ncbi:MAG: succinate dehydrogenase cytochrome b subunit [Desulfobulbaceae bacterium]|nr:succinate dehydrogenase cytochrome b subunit [Desulfobulbaceae bacterium]
MSWFLSVFQSSIGKKYIMALSGACLSFFLMAHLAGNTFSFLGKEAYNSYAAHLHSLGGFIHVLEACLALVFLAHILTAILLFIDNLSARPTRYAVSATDRSWSASTMPYTGALILIFLVVHLLNFHFASKMISTADQVKTVLGNPPLGFFYLVALSGLTLHISHGFWSLFQSFGANHPQYNRFLQRGGLSMAVILGALFMLIPLLALTTDGFLQ